MCQEEGVRLGVAGGFLLSQPFQAAVISPALALVPGPIRQCTSTRGDQVAHLHTLHAGASLRG